MSPERPSRENRSGPELADLKLGDKINVLTDPEEVIVSVSYAEEEAAAETEAVEEPEVLEKGKKEAAE
jgi:hypothetical protein